MSIIFARSWGDIVNEATINHLNQMSESEVAKMFAKPEDINDEREYDTKN